MSEPYLNSVTISDFRSIRGTVTIPLDGPVILIHGPNGTGKTSIMSAIELALTGDVQALHRTDPQYRRYLTHRDATRGEIKLTVADLITSGISSSQMTIKPGSVEGRALLDSARGSFFSERCYLAQATLGRLLELYQHTTGRGVSPLTQFVKDLLGLDHLDALIDGLQATGDVRNVRRMVPAYAQTEALIAATKADIAANRTHLQELASRASDLRSMLDGALHGLDPDASHWPATGLPDSLEALLAANPEEPELVRIAGIRRDLSSLHGQARATSAVGEISMIGSIEIEELKARDELTTWREVTGKVLENIVTSLRVTFPDLPSLAMTDPAHAYATATERVDAEIKRCRNALTIDEQLTVQLSELEQTIARARTRIDIADERLTGLTADAGSLAEALAALLPHIHGDNCPVCDRGFREVSDVPLVVRVTSHVARLSEQAEQLTSIGKARSELQKVLTDAERECAIVVSKRLTQDTRTMLLGRVAQLTEAKRQLVEVEGPAKLGAGLMSRHAEFLGHLAELRMHDTRGAEIRSNLDSLCVSLDLSPLATGETTLGAIERLLSHIANKETALTAQHQLRRRALGNYRQLVSLEKEIRDLQAAMTLASKNQSLVQNRLSDAVQARSVARKIALAAEEARTAIVSRVLNGTLNRVWRDLFVRLAPTEPYVPAFRLPESPREPVSAQIHTVHREGGQGGSPGAMLSAGNLSTAALTLFLALHLSVKPVLPWLILDDPVQSMDEVHISQFAALLRTLSKGQNRQVVIAVHDRALFEYLALELSPAFPGDRLITLELSRSLDGTTGLHPNYLNWQADRALAA